MDVPDHHLWGLAYHKGCAAIVRIEQHGRTSDSTAIPLRNVDVRMFLSLLRRKTKATPTPT
jgi:hypothetical protein